MTVQLQANKPLTKVNPTELFTDALPKVLTAYKAKGMKVTGTYEINIFGKDGGRWFINAGEAVCRNYNSDKTDCVLEMGIDEFRALTTGSLDAAKAMQEGRVRFRGNPEQLIQLGHLLAG